jgi:hypothetical protein
MICRGNIPVPHPVLQGDIWRASESHAVYLSGGRLTNRSGTTESIAGAPGPGIVKVGIDLQESGLNYLHRIGIIH